MRRANLVCGCLLAIAGSGSMLFAATPDATLNLSTFVNNTPGATPLQVAAGRAVQAMCTQLAGVGARSATQQELFYRCNELVENARALQNGPCTPPNDNCATIDRSLGLNATGLLNTLQQVSGEEVNAQGALTTQVSSGQFANISGRLSALRFGTNSAAARGRVAGSSLFDRNSLLADVNSLRRRPWADSWDDPGVPGNASHQPLRYYALPASDAAASGGGSIMQPAESPWGWFTEGSYSFGDHDQTSNEDGFDFDAQSVTGGVDYNFGSAVLGASLGYDRYNADFDTAALVTGGKVKVDGASASLFGAWFGERTSLNGIFSYGKPDSDVTRVVSYTPVAPGSGCVAPATCPVQNRSLTGSPDGRYFAAGTTLSYDTTVASWSLEPSLSLSYRKVDIDSYRETDSLAGGGLALAYDSQSIKSFRSVAGLALSKSFSRSFGIVTPNARLEWHHEFEDDARTLVAKYVVDDSLGVAPGNFGAGCVSCFGFSSDAPDKDFAVAGVGLSATFARRLQAYLYAETLLGSAHVTSTTVALGLRGQF